MKRLNQRGLNYTIILTTQFLRLVLASAITGLLEYVALNGGEISDTWRLMVVYDRAIGRGLVN